MTDNGPRISVIIPVRNRPDVIHRAIDSALAQTRAVDEIVVVDDGSTDDTPDSVERRIAEVPHLRLIRLSPSGGAPRARNTGAAASTGDFLAFLDSDDAWEPEKIERQLALMLAYPESPAAVCGTRYEFRGRPSRSLAPPEIVSLATLQESNVAGGSSAGFVRRAAFEQVGGFTPDLPACQDWDLWSRLAELGDLRAVREPMVRYFFDGGARITKVSDRVERGHAYMFERIYAAVSDPKRLRRVKSAHAKRLAEIYSGHHFRPVKAMGQALRSVWLRPSAKQAVIVPRVAVRLLLYWRT